MALVFFQVWAKIVYKQPWLILFNALIFWIGITVYCWFKIPLPSFNEPLLGFEARGTDLSDKINAWKLFLKSSEVTMYPFEDNQSELNSKGSGKLNETEADEEKLVFSKQVDPEVKKRMHYGNKSAMFCGNINQDQVQVVIESNLNMLDIKVLNQICNLDHRILRLSQYPIHEKHFLEKCEVNSLERCCNSWSMPNYVAVFSNKSSCEDLVQEDAEQFRQLLEKCLPFYEKSLHTPACVEEMTLCGTVLDECKKHEKLIFTVFHYLVLTEGLTGLDIRLSNVFLPMAKSDKLQDYFEALETLETEFENVKIVGLDLGLKYAVFESLLLSDSQLLGIAGLIVFLLIYIHTNSFLITLFIILSVFGSLTFSYFVYHKVYQISFFPFMNFVAVVICVAIGSDNGLIVCRYWASAKKKTGPCDTLLILAEALEAATVSTFFASFTTSIAFMSSYFTNITSIKCFSVFASTVVFSNFFFTMLCVPPAVILSETVTSMVLNLYIDSGKKKISSFLMSTVKILLQFRSVVFIIIICSLILSTAVISHSLKWQSPSADDMQLLRSNHLFERYDLIYRKKFNFANAAYLRSEDDSIPIWMVFGFRPFDAGDFFNPYSRGTIKYEEDFFGNLVASQNMLVELCRKFQQQSFAAAPSGPIMTNCFLEMLRTWISQRRCYDHVLEKSNLPCCENSSFPFTASTLQYCIHEANKLTSGKIRGYINSDVAGLWYSRKSRNVTALISEYYIKSSTVSQWEIMNDWINNETKNGSQNFWIIWDGLEKVALYDAMLAGTKWSVLITLCIAFFSVLILTVDVFLTLLAVFTTLCIILETFAVIILLGWTLNIVECVCLSITIGLSLDSILHYIIAYRLSPKGSKDKTMEAFKKMAGPVLLANLTTFSVGFVMTFANVLPYVQFGKFLVTLSMFSWMLSSLLFLMTKWKSNCKTYENSRPPERMNAVMPTFRYPFARVCL